MTALHPCAQSCFVCVTVAAAFRNPGFAPSVWLTSLPVSVLPGQLLWRRFNSACPPSHSALRATFVQLLPLVEMYYKWVLCKDCSNLWDLMVRFDSEAKLGSHELGRSMLQMLHGDEGGLQIVPPPVLMPPPVSPFTAIRFTFAAMDVALQAMRPQVHIALDVTCLCSLPGRSCGQLAPHCACYHIGLCPSPFNANFDSPKVFVGLPTVSFVPIPPVAICFRGLWVPGFFRSSYLFVFSLAASASTAFLRLQWSLCPPPTSSSRLTSTLLRRANIDTALRPGSSISPFSLDPSFEIFFSFAFYRHCLKRASNPAHDGRLGVMWFLVQCVQLN